MPDLSLLKDYSDQMHEVSREELEKNNRRIVTTLKDYKISISKISARVGPTVTLYEVVPAPGVRVAQIMRLEDDIARSLAARGVRVVTLAGTNAIGIEVANEKPSIVSMKSIMEDPKFNAAKYDLPVVIGRTISNEAMSFDLAKMPHLLVAGATGQGKSVGLNAIITSLLYKKHPSELKFVLVDPKKVELSLYSPLEKHYLAKLPDAEEAIITDTKRVVYTLRSLCKLMDHRYDLLKAASVRNVKEYNEKFLSRKLNPYKGHEYMPYIVVIIDEFADLLMTAGREIEEPIARLAQLARAIGIHLVIATQRPTTNIITGTIKANFSGPDRSQPAGGTGRHADIHRQQRACQGAVRLHRYSRGGEYRDLHILPARFRRSVSAARVRDGGRGGRTCQETLRRSQGRAVQGGRPPDREGAAGFHLAHPAQDESGLQPCGPYHGPAGGCRYRRSLGGQQAPSGEDYQPGVAGRTFVHFMMV